mgnify:CR=1 FL=1
MKKKTLLIIITIFLLFCFVVLLKGLSNSNTYVPDTKIGKQFLSFKAKKLFNNEEVISDELFFENKIYLLNLWASWCVPCRTEHHILMQLSSNPSIRIIGLNYKDKKVVVIGSGATAVTIVPKIAEDVSKVTMLQRTPTYIAALPNKDKIAKFLKFILPSKIAHTLVRIKNILADMLFYNLCRKFPKTMKKFILKGIKKELGNEFPLEPHFSPNYRPWDQRFCLVPDGDFFKAIKKGKADVITDSIDVFIENGILLKSGKIIEADIIISATGLKLLPFGGAKISLNNTPFDITKQFIYKGLMLSELPNFLVFAGYTNASWTLKSDLTSEYISRLLKYLDKNNYNAVYAKVIEENLGELPLIDLDSGYIHRAKDILPKQGDQFPWRLYQNYIYHYYHIIH